MCDTHSLRPPDNCAIISTSDARSIEVEPCREQ